jgi:hypothetical protein
MPKINTEWKVLPHGPVKTVDDRILTVEGDIPMPLGKFPRRMTVVGLGRNRSVIFSAIALREAAMKRIEQLGKPTFLIVPNGHHRLDASIWKQRYPKLKIICPPGARKSVAEAVPVDSTDDIMNDKAVSFVTVDGTGRAEGALIVRRKGATTLIVNDVIANVRHPPGIGAKVMARLFGFGVKRPQVPRVVKRVMVENRRALAAQFREWAHLEDLRRLVPSHGEIIDRPTALLERLASEVGDS